MKRARCALVLGTILTTSLICMLMLAFNFTVAELDEIDRATGVSVTQAVDWWPMFRHDLNHTGYSTSKAPNTSALCWSYKTGDSVHSSPAVADGKVYVGSYDNKVYCLNASTGTKIWNYNTGDYVYSCPAVADGKVFIGSADDKVYCFGGPSRADVAVTNVGPYKTVVGQGYCTTIDVNVQNQGNMQETFNVTTYCNSNVINYTTVTNLPPGEEITLTFTWNTTGVPKGNYTMSAYAWPVPGETVFSDNNFTDGWVVVTIKGDVDGDFDVDIYDVVKITGIYGSKRGDPQFKPNSDLDDDGEITIYDVVRCTSHYGEKNP